MSESDRRGFFKDLLKAAAEAAQEVQSAMRSIDVPDFGLEQDDWNWEPPRPVKVPPSAKVASDEEIAALCREHGLEARLGDVLQVARTSVRLTRADEPAAGPGASRLGGVPDVPARFEWPTWQGRDLSFLGQIRLEDVAALDPASPLPASGLLLFFYDAASQPTGVRPGDRGSCRVLLVEGDAEPHEPGRGVGLSDYPLALSLERTLPRAWSSAVDALELDTDELSAWDEARKSLAALQGVELEDHSPDWHAIHRLLGHPEELGGQMALDCQLASNGIDLSEGDGYADPRTSELEAGVGDWRLLLQVSADGELGTAWGDGLGRLYLWIRGEDLEAHRFGRAWALLQ